MIEIINVNAMSLDNFVRQCAAFWFCGILYPCGEVLSFLPRYQAALPDGWESWEELLNASYLLSQ